MQGDINSLQLFHRNDLRLREEVEGAIFSLFVESKPVSDVDQGRGRIFAVACMHAVPLRFGDCAQLLLSLSAADGKLWQR